MKKSPKQIMEAYKAINELALCVFPYKVTRQVHKLRKKLSEEFETILNTEQAMVRDMGGQLQDRQYHFENLEDAQAFQDRYQEWLNQQDDVDLPQANISKCLDAVKISSTSIEALEGLVDFGEV